MNTMIKVCGMTDADNIRDVEVLGVDMIGFIFYPKSPDTCTRYPGTCLRLPNVSVFLSTKPKKTSLCMSTVSV